MLPEVAADVDPAFQLREAFERGSLLFHQHQDDLPELFATHPGINRRSYNKRNVARWLRNAGRYFEGAVALPLDEFDLDRFTPRRIASRSDRLKDPPPSHPFFDACADIAAAMSRFEQRRVGLKRRFLTFAAAEAERRKAAENIYTFDDLLRRMDTTLAGPSGERLRRAVRGRFGAILIDEFQDTDARQYRIFRGIFGGTPTPFFLIGDPKQSIYGFRGADVFSYLRATEDSAGSAFTLDRNWRSDPSLIHAVNALFTAIPRPFTMPSIAFRPVMPAPDAADRFTATSTLAPLELRFLPRETEADGLISRERAGARLPPLVAADIAAELSREEILGRQTEPPDIAVLVRTNAEAREIQRALFDEGIHGVLWGEASVLDSLEADELSCVLAAVAEPRHPGRLLAALSTRVFGLNAGALRELQADGRALEGWIGAFDRWRGLWNRRGFIQMFFTLLHAPLKGAAPITRLADGLGGERAITNFRHLAELLEQRAAARDLGMAGLLEWLERARSGERGEGEDDVELRLESDENAVRIITIHKSKGLQFNIVYCPYLWEVGLPVSKEQVAFHAPEPPHTLYLDIGTGDREAHRGRAEQEAEAERMRLLYVALTRARHRCLVVWGAFGEMPGCSLSRLLHPSRDAAELERISDEVLREDLLRLAKASGGAVRVGAFEARDPVAAGGTGLSRYLSCRKRTGVLSSEAYTVSFTSLTAGGGPRPDIAEGRDDERLAAAAGRGSTSTAVVSPKTTPVELDEFERGPRAGSCLHEIFEVLDFTDSDPGALREVVADRLAAFGYDVRQWTEPVCRMVRATLTLPLNLEDPGHRLDRVGPDRRLNELEFIFPMSRPVSLGALFTALSGRGPWPPGYTEKIAAAGGEPLRGFMKGFIDLVFERGGRYYIVDYKSNYLGPLAEDYGADRLTAAMAAHHYYLQYLLYTVALDRFLAMRLRKYDYNRCFGGVYYLFLRGIQPGRRTGLFFHRPDQRLVRALDGCFGGEASGRAPGPSFPTEQLSLPGFPAAPPDASGGRAGGGRRRRR